LHIIIKSLNNILNNVLGLEINCHIFSKDELIQTEFVFSNPFTIEFKYFSTFTHIFNLSDLLNSLLNKSPKNSSLYKNSKINTVFSSFEF
jgi:hypothetical protein